MASIQKRHGPRGIAYRVHYRDATGHQVVKTFHRLEDARSFRATVEAHRPDDVVASRISLRRVFEEMAQRHDYADNTKTTQASYIRAIERSYPGLFDLDVGKVSGIMLDKAIMGIQAPNMRRRCRVFLGQVLTFAVRMRYLDRAPMLPEVRTFTRAARMDRKRDQERPLDTSEIETILRHLPERYHTMVTLMAYMGLRPGEAYGLQLQDVDFDARTLTVQRAVSRGKVGPTKTGETRTLPLGGLADLLGTLDATASGDFLFTNDQGNIIHENTFREIFVRACRKAGIPNNVTPNSLRHHAAAWMIGRGVNVLQVSRMLGHSKPSITLDVYAYLFSDSLEAVALLLPQAPLPTPALSGR